MSIWKLCAILGCREFSQLPNTSRLVTPNSGADTINHIMQEGCRIDLWETLMDSVKKLMEETFKWISHEHNCKLKHYITTPQTLCGFLLFLSVKYMRTIERASSFSGLCSSHVNNTANLRKIHSLIQLPKCLPADHVKCVLELHSWIVAKCGQDMPKASLQVKGTHKKTTSEFFQSWVNLESSVSFKCNQSTQCQPEWHMSTSGCLQGPSSKQKWHVVRWVQLSTTAAPEEFVPLSLFAGLFSIWSASSAYEMSEQQCAVVVGWLQQITVALQGEGVCLCCSALSQ